MENDQEKVIAKVRRSSIEPRPLHAAFFYPALPLCVIDALFSINVRYSQVEGVVRRFCEWAHWTRELRDANVVAPGTHTLSEFLELLNGTSPDRVAAEVFGNRGRTSPINGILKADAVCRFSAALVKAGVDDFPDITPDKEARAKALVKQIPGQRSGISFGYFLMLAGDERHVKPDRHITRFVANALCAPSVTAHHAQRVIVAAANSLAREDPRWTPRLLDYLIWEHESQKRGSVPQ